MDTIVTFLQALINSPHYSFGWIVVAILAILPAIVSANLVQHELSRLLTGKNNTDKAIQSLLINTVILIISLSVISYAFYLYFWI